MKEAGDTGVVTRDRSDEQVLFAFMQSIARQQPGRRLALDVGACDGQSGQPYAQAGWLVISLDIVMQGLRLGLQVGRIQPGRAVVADGHRLPFRDATFNLVSSRWFLHEFPDQPAFLGEMRRVVRDGGVIVAVDFAAPGHASQAFLNRYILPDEHARTRGEFAAPWADVGLAPETVEWHAWQMTVKNDEIRKEVCGPEGNVPTEVKNELHITCDDKGMFLNVPIALVVAHRMAPREAPHE